MGNIRYMCKNGYRRALGPASLLITNIYYCKDRTGPLNSQRTWDGPVVGDGLVLSFGMLRALWPLDLEGTPAL